VTLAAAAHYSFNLDGYDVSSSYTLRDPYLELLEATVTSSPPATTSARCCTTGPAENAAILGICVLPKPKRPWRYCRVAIDRAKVNSTLGPIYR
jgi:hypothetical protein